MDDGPIRGRDCGFDVAVVPAQLLRDHMWITLKFAEHAFDNVDIFVDMGGQ